MEDNKSFGPDAHVAVTKNGTIIGYVIEDTPHRPEVWITKDCLPPRRVTRIAPNLESYSMGQSRLIEWKDSDGQSLKSALLLPIGFVEGSRYIESDLKRTGVTLRRKPRLRL